MENIAMLSYSSSNESIRIILNLIGILYCIYDRIADCFGKCQFRPDVLLAPMFRLFWLFWHSWYSWLQILISATMTPIRNGNPSAMWMDPSVLSSARATRSIVGKFNQVSIHPLANIFISNHILTLYKHNIISEIWWKWVYHSDILVLVFQWKFNKF